MRYRKNSMLKNCIESGSVISPSNDQNVQFD